VILRRRRDYRLNGSARATPVYDCYRATHALCGVHLIREPTAVAEQHPEQL
jgi:hypothetical protein